MLHGPRRGKETMTPGIWGEFPEKLVAPVTELRNQEKKKRELCKGKRMSSASDNALEITTRVI